MQPRRHPRGRAARDRRPEPGHQPPADAHRAGEGQAQRRQDPRDQPAARGRADAVRQPADAARPRRRRHRARRPAPADPGQRRPRAVPGDRRAAARVGRARPRLRRPPHHRLRRLGTAPRRPRLGRPSSGPPGCPARRSRPRPRMFADSAATIVCWAMGLTQHRNAVATIRRSPTSRCSTATSASPAPACARCAATPTCRATGRWGSGRSRRPRSSTPSPTEFGFEPPREHGLDTVDSIRAMRDGQAKVFIAPRRQLRLGRARHRGHRGGAAQRRADRAGLDQAQPLARRRRPRGADPADPRPHRARPHGRPRPARHGRGLDVGRCTPRAVRSSRPSPHLRSEVAIVCGIAQATLGDRHDLPWDAFRADYTRHPPAHRPRRARLRRRTPRRSSGPAASCCRTRRATRARSRPPAGQAQFTRQPARRAARARRAAAAADAAQPRPVQHHDLRARRPLPRHPRRPPGGVRPPRRHRRARPRRRADRRPRQRVDRRLRAPGPGVPGRALRPPRGCAAAYFPETNVLVPLDSTAIGSNCPTSKSIIVRLEPRHDGRAPRTR